jgi:hypothetical protein
MTTDFPTAPPAYGLEGPSAGRTVEKPLSASHTEILTLPGQDVLPFPIGLSKLYLLDRYSHSSAISRLRAWLGT